MDEGRPGAGDASRRVRSEEADTLERLGEHLRRARLRRNLSQAEMAARAGVTRRTYASLEAGARTASLALLARALESLGYRDRLATLLEHDPIGDEIVAASSRKRAGGRRGLADF